MALFKISKGNSTNLPALSNSDDGFSWFTYDDGKFYIDYKDPADNILKRKALNAVSADNALQAGSATKATQDESGNNIKATYAASFSISDHTITLKNKNGASLGTVTVPDNDTKNTAGSTDTSNKIFLIGATSQAANPQTYSDNEVFVTDGTLSTKNLAVSGIANLNGETSADSLTVGNLQVNGSTNFVNAPTVSDLAASQSVITDANKKLVSKDLTVSSATAETTTATTFVYSVTSDATGKITVKTRPLPTYNNYSLPLAASGTRGGIQIGYSESDNNYAVKLSNEKAYVTVPWTDTKVTSVGDHYTPAADANAALSASASGASAAWSIDVVKAIQLQRDAKGHVTGITVTSGKIPGNPNTDYRVRQTNDTATNANYRLLLSNSANDTQEDNISRKNANLIYNPSTNKLSTGNIKLTGELDVTGNAYLRNQTTADSLTAGSLIINGSANFIQSPTAPTPASGDNSTKLATTEFVKTSVAGLSGAMHFKGTTTSTIVDGSTTNPIVIGGSNYTAAAGDVVLREVTTGNIYEYVWTGSAWEMLGRDTSFKVTQDAVASPSASGSTTAFIDTISQDTNGNITVTKKNLDTSGTWSGNAATATKVNNNLVIKLKSGTTEGTDLYTFNGSAGKTLDIKQGTGITLTAAVGSLTIDNAGVRSIATGSTNGTISVNTNGTSADVAVKGLGSAAYTASTAYIQFGGDDIDLGSGSPAATAKTYWADATKVPTAMIKGYYNHSGVEYSLLFSKATSGSYGSVLKWGYNDTYVRILRMQNGSWKSDDWEKISAGYADSAGSVAWSNVTGKPSTTLVTDTGTSSITLAHGGKYKLTAGGSSIIFTMPTDNNTDIQVSQTETTTSNWRKVLVGYQDSETAGAAVTGPTNVAYTSTGLEYKPSSGMLRVKGLTREDYVIIAPPGGSCRASSDAHTGAIKITLPVSWTSTMINMKVDIYDYTNQSVATYHISGYNYSNGSNSSWINTMAYSTGKGNKSNLTVRYGHDGSKCCIFIGEIDTAWHYPQITVRDVTLGFGGYTAKAWMDAWAINFVTEFPTATSSTIRSNPNSLHKDLILKIKSGSTEGTDLYTFNGSASKTLDIKQGTGITLTAAAGSLTIANAGVTGAKGNNETDYRTGQVNITPANILGSSSAAKFWRGDNTWSNTLTGDFNVNGNATFSGETTADSLTAGNLQVNGSATFVNTISGNINGNAATATKLGTSNVGAADRPIYLSAGSATQTTYRMAGTNATATTAVAITGDLDTGIWYVNGTNSTDLYSVSDGVAYVNKYSNSWIHEIYGDYRTGQIAVRGKNNGTWQAWRKVLDSSNYTNWTVTKTGTGASGTWEISISGTATKATADGSGNNIVNTYLTKAAGVTNVAWDNTNKKFTKTINGSTTDIVTPYAANLKLNNAATYKAQPEVASVKINGKIASGDTDAASTKNVQLVYDASLEVLNFVFS